MNSEGEKEEGKHDKFGQWLAVKEALKLDEEGGESDYDPVTGWGVDSLPSPLPAFFPTFFYPFLHVTLPPCPA